MPAANPLANCPKCSAQLAPGQDWCVQCGAGAPGSVGGGTWKGAAWVLALTAALVLGAAAAGYAALSSKTRRAPVMTTTVAQAAPPVTATTTPTVTTPTTASPFAGLTKPPKIPLKAVTPTSTATTPTTSTTTEGASGTKKQNSATDTGGASTESQPEPILLDTDAASTYNPYDYPAGDFGDPSLTIDGDTSTGWSALVNPATAPKLAEGILIDLKTPQKISSVKLVTSTPGMTVQIFGANGKTEPTSITDPAWVALSHSIVVRKRHAKIGLNAKKKKAYRYITLWISKAPASSVGTAEVPGKVAVNELELFPPS
jgi:hypothetical protein